LIKSCKMLLDLVKLSYGSLILRLTQSLHW